MSQLLRGSTVPLFRLLELSNEQVQVSQLLLETSQEMAATQLPAKSNMDIKNFVLGPDLAKEKIQIWQKKKSRYGNRKAGSIVNPDMAKEKQVPL